MTAADPQEAAVRAIAAALREQSAPKPEAQAAGDRDAGGRLVREAWVRWALTQPNPKPSWLVPYDELSEPDKEADRQIYEACALSTPASRDAQQPNVEVKAKAMFEAQADKMAAPWERQWEPTKEHWRAKARDALAQQPAVVGGGGFDAWWKSKRIDPEFPETLSDRDFAKAAWDAALTPAATPGDFRDAYEGAREDLLDWKGRAQRAEARLRSMGWQGITASEPPAAQKEGNGNG